MPKIITGTWDHADGSAVANGFLYLKLSQDATAVGTGQVAPRLITIQLTSTGSIPTNTSIYANDELSPVGTSYSLSVDDLGRGNVWGPEIFELTGSSPIDINSLVPIATSPPIIIEVQVVNTGTFNRLNAGLGTPLSSPDFALSGWGTGSTITNILGSDSMFQVTITAGTSPAVDPTIILTFHDGAWPQPPVSESQMVGGTGSTSDINNVATTTTLTLTYTGLPIATSTYIIQAFTIGSGVGSGGGTPSFDTTVNNITANDVILNGSTSGTTTLKASAIAGTTIATFPDNTGTVAETNFTQTWGGTQTYTNAVVLNGAISTYNGIATVSNGVPSEYATVDITNQTVAVSTATLYTPTSTGMFRISAALKITTVGNAGSNVGPLTITYTDGDGSVAQSMLMAFTNYTGISSIVTTYNSTTLGTLSGSMVIYAKTGVPIQYAVAIGSALGSGKYSLHLKLEAL